MPTTTYAVQHPNMSEALIMETSPHHSESFLVNMAVLYVMQSFDELLPRDGFIVRPVPADTVTINLFG
jgi:hypothetical protein